MEHGKEMLIYNLKNTKEICTLAKAMSSEIRLEILRLLLFRSMTMSELSQRLYVSISSINMHINILKEANLITITPKPGAHRIKKVLGIKAERIVFDLFESESFGSPAPRYQDIPIGAYAQAEASSPCGMVSKDGYIEQEDEGYCFYHPDRVYAQLIWFMTGTLVYHIANRNLKLARLKRVDLTVEVCSEAPGYNNTWPSDIFFKINNRFLAIFHSKSDYGGTRGINNPPWWRDSNTQFGDLVVLSVATDGVYLNNHQVSAETIDTLGMRQGLYFTFSIGVDPNAEFPGGMNLFGKEFGNYSQDIRVKTIYE